MSKNLDLQIIANGKTVFESYEKDTVGYAVLKDCGDYDIVVFGKDYMNKFPKLNAVYNKVQHELENLHHENNPIKFDENVAYIVGANLENCVELLAKDGINAKAKVKKQLQRLLDTYFEEEENNNQ